MLIETINLTGLEIPKNHSDKRCTGTYMGAGRHDGIDVKCPKCKKIFKDEDLLYRDIKGNRKFPRHNWQGS